MTFGILLRKRWVAAARELLGIPKRGEVELIGDCLVGGIEIRDATLIAKGNIIVDSFRAEE